MLQNYFSTKITTKQASDTGMAIILILLIIAMLTENNIFILISVIALVINMIFPNFYYPSAIVWLGLSNILGTIVSKIILSIVFFLLVVPVGLIRKLLRKDTLHLTDFKKSNNSVMKVRNYKFSASDIEKPY